MLESRRFVARVLGPAVALVGLAACQTEVPPVGPVDPDLRVLIDEHCQSVNTCACAVGLMPEGCTETLDERWEARREAARDLRLEYDAECFETLRTQVQDYECYWAGGSQPLCESFCAVFHGNAQLDEPCEGPDMQASTCAQGLACVEGTCVTPCTELGGRKQGEVCGSPDFGAFDDCAQGLWCHWSTNTCQPLPVAGAPCFEGGCGPDLWCDWQNNSCQPLPQLGQSCDGSGVCADGLFCEWEEIGSRCRAYAVEGESCAERQCEDSLFCNESNVCITAPREGELCLWGSVCDDAYVCDENAGLCVAPPDVGEPCRQGTCATGSWCDTSEDPEGFCALTLPTGEMCSGHRQCQSDFCPNGFCWDRPLQGESCEGSNVCAVGLVCNGLTCEATNTRVPAACGYAGW